MTVMCGIAAWGLYLNWKFTEDVLRRWGPWGYWWATLGPELAGIVIGVVFVNSLNERRQTRQLKAQLIRQMGKSPIKDVAVPAAELSVTKVGCKMTL